ncbi:MAG: ATP-binding protein [Candidatus Buchananbacteria bacterium]
MFFFAFSALVNLITSAIFGFLVFSKNRKNPINLVFSLFCFSIAFWSLGYYFWQVSPDYQTALFWCKFLMLGAIFIPVTYFNFVVLLTGLWKRNKLLVIFSYFYFSLFALFINSDSFISKLEPLSFFKFWPIAGSLYSIFLLSWFVLVIYSTYLLFYTYRRSKGSIRYQILYVFVGMLIGFIGGSSNYFLWYHVNIPPLGNIFVSVYVVFMAYSILKYRLMDMRVVGRTFLIYALDAIFVYAFYSLIIVIYPIVFGDIYNTYALLTGIIVAPFFVILMFWFSNFITRLVDKYFFYSLYDFRKTIADLTAKLNSYNDLNKIVDLIVETIKKTMGLSRTGVLLVDKTGSEIHYKAVKVVGFNINDGISLTEDNFLTKYLKKAAKPLVREEISLIVENSISSTERKSFLNLEKEMAHIEASLCLPLLFGSELRGIIVLGAKNSGDPYTQEDLNLLTTLSNQAAIAIDNARLYQEAKNFNKVLQKKVDEQTKELRQRAEHLQKLLEMRSEFLDIASHQLKTPVSVIKGTISMFRDGSMDKLPEAEKKKFFDNIYHKAEKLNVIIGDILRASEVDTEEFKIDPLTAQPVQLEDILKSIYGDLHELAESRGLKLNLVLPSKKLAPIMTNADFLEQALYNLVDNAIKYTAKGSVTLSLKRDGENLAVQVADTGIGIPEADKKKMFDKFSRAKNAVDMYADGSGLGLFIVKRIVEAHDGGSVVFDSQEGQGTTFTVRIKAAEKPVSGKK